MLKKNKLYNSHPLSPHSPLQPKSPVWERRQVINYWTAFCWLKHLFTHELAKPMYYKVGSSKQAQKSVLIFPATVHPLHHFFKLISLYNSA